MPFSGGVFSRIYNWVSDKNANTKITASRMDAEDDGFAAAINAIVSQTQPFIQPINAPNGTSALPSLTFTNDPNTGLYRKASDVLGVTAGGTNAVDFTTTGVKFTSGGSTIDYFATGTFTPTLVGLSTAGTGTYSTQAGEFIRIGNWVGFNLLLSWSAHTGTGDMEVRGLPHAAISGIYGACNVIASGVTIPAGDSVSAYPNVSDTSIRVVTIPSGGGVQSDIAMDTAGTFIIGGLYRTT